MFTHLYVNGFVELGYEGFRIYQITFAWFAKCYVELGDMKG